jgi:tetratricopeptide (TPR) repeat protein
MGNPGEIVYRAVIQLPKHYSARFPANVKFENEYGGYSSTYALDGSAITVERRLTVKKSKIPVSAWNEYLVLEKSARRDNEQWIQLLTGGPRDAAIISQDEARAGAASLLASDAETYLSKADFKHALESAEGALKIDESNTSAMAIKAVAQVYTGNLSQARSDLTAQLNQFPESPYLQNAMALVYLADKKFTDAEKLLNRLIEKNRDDTRAILSTALLYSSTDRASQALKLLQDRLKLKPDDQLVRAGVAAAALGTSMKHPENLAIAEKEYAQLTELQPDALPFYFGLAETLWRKGEIQRAVEVLKRGQAIAPDNPFANLQLALALENTGMRLEAQRFYQNAVDNDANGGIALNNLAFLLAEDGKDLDKALDYATRAQRLMPANDQVTDTLGYIYFKQQATDNAIAIFEDLVKRNPASASFRYHLGMALYQKGDVKAAKQHLLTALDLGPDKSDEQHIRELLAKIGAPVG